MFIQPDYLSLAIQTLKPNSEYKFNEQDYSTIEWFKLEGKAPTQAEIDAAIEQVKADEAQAEIDKAAKKVAAQAKLAALGLTADDLKALGL
jgi:tRNA A37 threonylcarbamoyladenosine biosynthesis protein TsaE